MNRYMILEQDFNHFLRCLLKAASRIESHYFQIGVAGSDKLVYRERVYCYELYHQLRNILGDGFPYKLDGEIDKEGHPIRPELGPKKPDFIVHVPGEMDQNLVVIEVKPIIVERRDLEKDINTLKGFLEKANYHRAIMYIYGDKGNRNDIVDIANNLIGDEERIVLVWHHKPKDVPEIVKRS